MQFLLSNEEGIHFPQLKPTYQEGELFFNRFRALVPRDARDSVIGEGGTGLIHLVRDELMDRIVALKLPHESILRDSSARFDVIRETRQAIELTHPNIVRIHDFHEGREGWGISMQYVRGMNLDEWRHVGRIGPRRSIVAYPVERITGWITQLCEALVYAHEDAHMVHRDIKPKNLMLETRDDGVEKLLLTDFGITQKLRLRTMMLSRVQPGVNEKNTMGTLPYMPWEQIQGSPASIRDDVYAIGATIYELLTGRPPFHEGGYEQIRAQIETVVPPPMAERLALFDLPDFPIPPEWEETVAACLAKKPEDRPRNVREIAERLGLRASAAAAGPVAQDDGKAAELRAEVEAGRQEIVSLKAEKQEKTAEAAQLGAELSRIQRELEKALKEAADWRDSLASSGAGSEELTRQMMELQAHLRGREDQLAAAAAEHAGLQGQLRDLEAQRNDYHQRLGVMEADLAEARRNAGKEQQQVIDALQAEIGAARQALDQARRDLMDQQAAAEKAVRDTEQNVRQKAEQAVHEARNEAQNARQEVEKAKTSQSKAEARLADMQAHQSAPVKRAYIVLAACLALGAGVGIVAGNLGGGPEKVISLDLSAYSGSIPSTPGETAGPVTAGLFREYLLAQSIPDADHAKVVPGIDALDDKAPVTRVTWWVAEQFCAWLTSREISAEERAGNRHFRIATAAEIAKAGGTAGPEWAADPLPPGNGTPTTARSVSQAGKDGTAWQVPSAGRTLDGRPLGFRVTLDAGR